MNNLVTIIMPIYNVKKYLRKSIESVLNQTYKKLEIILVDDGSTDGSGEICDEYKKKDKRITVIHKKNGGLSDARNRGYDAAIGDYIYFIDSDDYIEKDTIEYLLTILINTGSDISCSPYRSIKDGKVQSVVNKENNHEEIHCYNSEEALMKIFNLKEKVIGWEACNKLYKRNLFRNVRYPYAKKYEDVGTTFNLFGNAEKIVFSNIPKYNYVVNENSITHTYKFDIREFDRVEMAEYMRTYISLMFDNKKLRGVINNFVCTQYISVVNIMIRCNKKNKNLIRTTKSILLRYFFDIMKYGTKKGKMQSIIFIISPNLYKIFLEKYINNEKERKI